MSASGYVGAFMGAANAIYDVPEGRPVDKTVPLRLGVTVVLMVGLVASVMAVVLTGGLADRVGRLLGVGSAAVTFWDVAKVAGALAVVSSCSGCCTGRRPTPGGTSAGSRPAACSPWSCG